MLNILICLVCAFIGGVVGNIIRYRRFSSFYIKQAIIAGVWATMLIGFPCVIIVKVIEIISGV